MSLNKPSARQKNQKIEIKKEEPLKRLNWKEKELLFLSLQQKLPSWSYYPNFQTNPQKPEIISEKSFFKTYTRCMEKSLNIVQFNLLFLSHLASYLLMPGGSSFTTTLLLHAMRSLSVAIWLRGALWCICRTPSIWPLLRRPTFGGDAISKAGLRRAEGVKKIFLHFYDQSIKPKIWSLKIAKRLYGTLIRCQVALSFASDEVFEWSHRLLQMYLF